MPRTYKKNRCEFILLFLQAKPFSQIRIFLHMPCFDYRSGISCLVAWVSSCQSSAIIFASNTGPQLQHAAQSHNQPFSSSGHSLNLLLIPCWSTPGVDLLWSPACTDYLCLSVPLCSHWLGLAFALCARCQLQPFYQLILLLCLKHFMMFFGKL